MAGNRRYKLFNQNGCLTSIAMHSYVKGTAGKDEIQMIEDHLKTCQLCANAVKGFKSHLKTVPFKRDMFFLSRKVRRLYMRTSYRQPDRNLYVFLGLSVIAVMVLIALLYFLFRYLQISF